MDYIGGPEAKKHLESIGVDAAAYDGGNLSPGQLLVLGPGAARRRHPEPAVVGQFLAVGGRLLAIAIDQADADAVVPFKATLTKGEHIGTSFDAPGMRLPLAGVGPADARSREPTEVPLASAGATVIGDGSLAVGPRMEFRPTPLNSSPSGWSGWRRRRCTSAPTARS